MSVIFILIGCSLHFAYVLHIAECRLAVVWET